MSKKRRAKPRSKGKQKGAGFERDVCKALSRWVSAGEHEDLFWRSAMSGGRATVGRKGGKEHARHAGDISATSPEGHKLTDYWYVECKFYKDLDILAAFVNGNGKLAKFWRETVSQATHYKRLPMLIAKQNITPTLVLVPTAHLINPYGSAMYPKARLGHSDILRADILDFDGMLKLPFQPRVTKADEAFLKPGELARILNYEKPVRTKKKRKIKRERL